MTIWEKKIIDAFISHYFASEKGEDRSVLRIRSSIFFPNFNTAHPDEKESYLEAAESLERKGLVKLRWEKRDKGERLKTLQCENFEKLFEEAGRLFPKTEAEKIKTILDTKAKALKEGLAVDGETEKTAAENVIALLEFLSLHFSPREIGQGLNQQTMEEIIRLLEFSLHPAQLEKITIRALSILLYRDSKHLEYILSLCNPLLSRAQKSIHAPNLVLPQNPGSTGFRWGFPERSYPETMISGKIIITLKNSSTPLTNAGGLILGLPLESIEAISGIELVFEKKEKTALIIENKETFYALGSPQKYGKSTNLSCYDCFLYSGGYPNRAVAALIKILTASGFSLYHAGDLDPDGILILQNIQDIAERPVFPLRMDTATFDCYRLWARHLSKSMIRQIKKIREETKAIPGLASLVGRIEETGLGVEQEIIDYR